MKTMGQGSGYLVKPAPVFYLGILNGKKILPEKLERVEQKSFQSQVWLSFLSHLLMETRSFCPKCMPREPLTTLHARSLLGLSLIIFSKLVHLIFLEDSACPLAWAKVLSESFQQKQYILANSFTWSPVKTLPWSAMLIFGMPNLWMRLSFLSNLIFSVIYVLGLGWLPPISFWLRPDELQQSLRGLPP